MTRLLRALAVTAGAVALMLVPASAAQAAASGACAATTVTVTVTGAGAPDTVVAGANQVVVNGTPVPCTGVTSLIINGDGAGNQVDFTGSLAYPVDVNLFGGGDTFTATGTQAVDVDGGTGDDAIGGGSGADTLSGGDGDDTLRPGLGGGVNDGGSGAEANGDTVSYQDLAAAVIVNLDTDAVSGAVTQTAPNVENARGGTAGDTLIGDGADNDLDGLAGDDVLRPKLGGGVNDGGSGGETNGDTVSYEDLSAANAVTVDLQTNIVSGAVTQTVPNVENATGGAGGDTLIGDAATNRLDGLAGDDLLRPRAGGGVNDGGSGGETLGDTVTYQDLATGVTVNLDTDAVSGAVTQTVPNVENATGGSGGDTLVGDGGANRLEGLAGDDVLRPGLGGGVNDGGSGGETNGDTVSYEDLSAASAVTVNLETDSASGAVTQTIPNVENARGGAGADTLIGDAATNRLEGLAGDDLLRPKAGGGVNDGGSGGETVGDTVTYQDLVAAVFVDLDADTVSGAVTQTAPNVENATGGGGGDTLIGDAGANRLEGLAGDDVLRPKLGGGVNDGGSGGETNGDTVSYEDLSAAQAVTVDLDADTVSGAASQTVPNVENARGGAGDDTLIGDAQANRLEGLAGDDVLRPKLGGGVNDGGSGGETDGDTVSYQDLAAGVTVNLDTDAVSGAVTQTAPNVENARGGSGNDTLIGDDLDNDLDGQAGDDVLRPKLGAGVNDGGSGGETDGDTVSYEDLSAANAVTANLATDNVTGAVTQTVPAVENLTGGDGDDELVGDGGPNTLDGGEGGDTLTGAGGNDTLRGGPGTDALDGGSGDDRLLPGTGGGVNDGGSGGEADGDTVSYADFAAADAVTVDLDGDTVTGAVSQTVPNVENATGGAGDDTLIGDDNDNDLDGGAGDDLLRPKLGGGVNDGGSGGETDGDTVSYEDLSAANAVVVNLDADTVTGAVSQTVPNVENATGGAGDDTLIGDDDDNDLRGLAGDDVLRPKLGGGVNDGGSGGETDGDTVSYQDLSAGVVVNLDSDTVSGAVSQTVPNVENATGGAGNDTLIGDDDDNELRGLAGDDVLRPKLGGGVNDGGSGGEADGDTVSYQDLSAGVTVDLDGDTVSGAVSQTAPDVENATGGGDDDTLIGDDDDNDLSGLAGDDLLRPKLGGGVNDGGSGGETLGDTVTYEDLATGVTVNLDTDAVTGTVSQTVPNVENAIGGSGDDTLIGDVGANRLEGRAGDDVLRPGLGGGVNDGGSGGETDGDAVSYQDLSAASPVTVDLGADTVTGAVTQTVPNVENATGGAGDDTLIGDDGDNDLSGLAGDDLLRPKLGADVNDGGSGGETIGDTVSYQDRTTGVTVNLDTDNVSGAVTQTVPNVENARGGAGDDTLIGDALANRLEGLAGDDVLRPGLGGGVNDGGSGGETLGDTVTYQDLGTSVTVNLATDAVTGAVSQTVPNVENAIGGAGDDTLIGDAQANRLEGLAGDDVLRPGLGTGVNDGGSAAETNGDTVSYEDLGSTDAVTVNLETDNVSGAVTQTIPNIENATGGAGNDTLVGDDNENDLGGGAGDDLLRPKLGGGVNDGGSGGETNGDTVTYEDFATAVTVDLAGDTVTGAVTQTVPNVENAIGGSGDDTLIGDVGANRLEGRAGDDLLRPGLGTGVNDGGSGGETNGDTVSYQDLSAANAVTVDLDTDNVSGAVAQTVPNVENATGGAGGDTLIGDDDDNDLSGLAGDDILRPKLGGGVNDGGSGGETDGDTISYQDLGAPVTVNLEADSVSGAVTQTIPNVENATGGGGDDTLIGDDDDNDLSGLAGDDLLRPKLGGGVNDGGSGGETVGDTVTYQDLATGVTVNLATDAVSGAVTQTVPDVENAMGGSGDDTLVGDAQANRLEGLAGDDVLRPGLGGGVNDGGSGGETNGDTVSYQDLSSASAVTVNLDTDNVSGAVTQTIPNVENARGGAGGDTLIGDDNDNDLDGGPGDDLLRPKLGGGVNDGGSGGETNGDTVSYMDLGAAVTVDLDADTVSGAVTQTVPNVENATGTGANDTLIGDDNANDLDGGAGDDLLRPKLGGGINQGGSGGETDGDTVSYQDLATGVTVNLDTDTVTGAVTQTVPGIENARGGAGSDTLIGDAQANRLEGLAGDDVLRPKLGAGVNDGGSGGETDGDTVSYEDLATGVTVNLESDNVSGAVTQTVPNVENARGGSGGDTLIGDDLDNDLDGGAGDDLLRPKLGGGVNQGGSGGETDGDTVTYEDLATAVTVNLTSDAVSGAVTQTVPGIENARGGAGSDTLIGDAQANRLEGLAGDDVLRPNLGGGVNDGGSGGETNGDTVSYQDLATGVTVNLDSDAVTGAVTQTVPNVENATGGAGSDTLIGDAAANRLEGLAGDDVLRPKLGGGVNDGGSGGETSGDTVSYEDLAAANAVTVDLDADTVTGAVTQTVPNVENATGGAGNDQLIGDGLANTLIGGAGNDTLTGAGGVDNVQGGLGDDVVVGGADAGDTLDGGTGAGVDTLTYAGVPTAIVVNLSGVLPPAGTDNAAAFENVIGGDGADTIIGDGADNTLSGGPGDDVLQGRGGQDVLNGNAHGALGDTASYEERTTAVTASLASGVLAEDTSTGIENLVGGSAGDTLIGDAGVNRLEGRAGNDELQGRGADDALDGGADSDTASYADRTSSEPVTASIVAGSGGASGESDTYTSIENLVGGAGNDTLTQGAGASNPSGDGDLSGGDGDDVLVHGPGNGTISGGGGNDTLRPGLGVGTVNGGGGTDTVDYSAITDPLTADLATGSATATGLNHTLAGDVENVIGGSAADTLTGSSVANELRGGPGADTISGGAGADTLDGEGDNDTITGGAGDDVIEGSAGNDTLTGDDGADVLTGGQDTDTVSYASKTARVVVTLDGIANDGVGDGGATTEGDNVVSTENVVGGSAGDRLVGDQAPNLLQGGPGDDVLVGAGNSDLLEGQDGRDTASYEDHASDNPVRVSLADAPPGGGGRDERDTLTGVEVLRGGAGPDTLIGATGDDGLFGGPGADTLVGGGGNDVVAGEDGNDQLAGEEGDDSLAGAAGADRIDGGLGADVIEGGADDDDINAFDGLSDLISCGDGSDRLDYDRFDSLTVGDCEFIRIPGEIPAAIDAGPDPVRDRDSDGALGPVGGPDCNDLDPAIRPGAPEIPGNGIDENCDGRDAPFPQITTELRLGGGPRGKGLRIKLLLLTRVPAKSSIEVRCTSKKSPKCLFKTRTRTTGARPTARLSLRGLVGDRALSFGTVIEVRVTSPNAIGRVFKLTLNRKVTRATRCLPPGATTPVAC